MSVSFDDEEIVFTFTNVSGQRRLVTVTLTTVELLRLPDRPLQEMIKAGDADEVARVRIEDVWGSWRYGYTFTAKPAS
ncbi:MAG: hypothetical protein ACI80V_002415 [Rhodothermales bacterium]|jgi:hypothetical protein